MTNDELKDALFRGCPIDNNGVVYKCISAIIYRVKEGKLVIAAELLDKNENSISIVNPDRIKEAKQ